MFPIIPITRLRLSLKWILLPATHSQRPPVTVITKGKKTGIIRPPHILTNIRKLLWSDFSGDIFRVFLSLQSERKVVG